MGVGTSIALILGLLAALGAGIGIAFYVRHRRYVNALEARGWSFDGTPGDEVANGLLVPPFGIGFDRGPDDLIWGRTRSGQPFSVFRYQAAGNAFVLRLPLALPLPELVVTVDAGERPGVGAPVQSQHAGLLVRAWDPAFASEFGEVAEASVGAFAARYRVSLAVDGDSLTLVGAPRDPDELGAYLDAAAPIAQALSGAAPRLERFRQPAPHQRLGFYLQPTWHYRARDDALLDVVDATRGGQGHRTEDVVEGELYPGAHFVAFKHHWQTTRTETYTDGQGRSQTRIVTDHHCEVIHEVALPFAMPDLAISPDSMFRRLFKGRSLDFESAAFNQRFDVFCDHPKFAYDVIHPRQMEYLLATGATFSIRSSRVRLPAAEHSEPAIHAGLALLAGFVARIPAFVWRELGVGEPPMRLTPAGDAEIVR